MSKRASLALTALAAKKENKKSSIPSSEAVGAIDDVLSVVKNISFFGSGAKTYSNEKDELSGAYCTAPVKYEFKDRKIVQKQRLSIKKNVRKEDQNSAIHKTIFKI
jgi:hypothetical protein